MINLPYPFSSFPGILFASFFMQLECELTVAESHEEVPPKPPPGVVKNTVVAPFAEAVASGSLPSAEMKGFALYPGDFISIDVFDQPDLSLDVRGPPNGGIRFPLLGEIPIIVGRKINDFAAELKSCLEKDYLRQATLTVTVRDLAKQWAYVMGSVAPVDTLYLSPFSRTTVLGANGEAGGFLD